MEPVDPNLPGQPPAVPSRRRRYAQVLGLVLCAGLIAVGVAFYLRESISICDAQDPGTAPARRDVFTDWGKPEVALLLSGQLHGYLQPCGCSEPQLGGLARRYNFLQSLKDRGWPVVAVDLGDLAQRSGPQAVLKYTKAMEALHLLGYTAIAAGKNEMDMPLIEALSNYSLNNPAPRVLGANLLDSEGQFQDMLRPLEVSGKDTGLKVGVLALIGPSVSTKVRDTTLKFADNKAVLKKSARALADKKADLIVLLYQGSMKEGKALAEFWAGEQQSDPTLPRIHVIQCLSEEEDPPSLAEKAGRSMVVTVGQKGRFVGVVAAYRTDKANEPLHLRYKLVTIGPEFQPEKGKAPNPIQTLMEEYTKELKDRDYLARFPRTPHPIQAQFPKARYVGSERCVECHEYAYKVWEKSRHFKAYETLVATARDPSLRQYDGECVVCHVVGFGHPTGFYDKGVKPETEKWLKAVGCESCHGPASEHVKNPGNTAMYRLLNPWKAKPGESQLAARTRLQRIDNFCQKCHDIDNDVHWSFDKNWPQIIHTTPQKGAN
jgi:Cytochrome c554 and c-prime